MARAKKKKEPAPAIVRELTPAEHNPCYISDRRNKQLGKSMTKFGDLSGIVFNVRSKRLVCGHQRIKHLSASAKIRRAPAKDEHGTVAIGSIVSGSRASWPYREVDWDEKTEKAACIAANAAGGDFEETKLKGLVLELDQVGFEMDLLNLKTLDQILNEGAEDRQGANADDLPGVKKKAIARRGDVWICGEHRIMCGDSTSRQDVQKLMGHAAAAMVFTDPPYGVSYEAKSGDFDVIQGDHKRNDELHALVTAALKQATHFTTEDAGFYIWHAWLTRRAFEDAMRDVGLIERQCLVWDKHSIALGHNDYHWAHEPCYYASKDGKKPAFYGDRAQPTLWRATLRQRAGLATTLGKGVLLTDGNGGSVFLIPKAPKGKKPRSVRMGKDQVLYIETQSNSRTVIEVKRDTDYVHPTQKPVELARRAITNSSRPGEAVLDLFGGSGTTLIGCEITGRQARLMEIDPIYVDATVKRWEEYTGRKATKETKKK